MLPLPKANVAPTFNPSVFNTTSKDELLGELEQVFDDSDPENVFLLIPPNPSEVVPGTPFPRRHLYETHIEWFINNVAKGVTKYARNELTGEQKFWIPKAKEFVLNNPKASIPLDTRTSPKAPSEAAIAIHWQHNH